MRYTSVDMDKIYIPSRKLIGVRATCSNRKMLILYVLRCPNLCKKLEIWTQQTVLILPNLFEERGFITINKKEIHRVYYRDKFKVIPIHYKDIHFRIVTLLYSHDLGRELPLNPLT